MLMSVVIDQAIAMPTPLVLTLLVASLAFAMKDTKEMELYATVSSYKFFLTELSTSSFLKFRYK